MSDYVKPATHRRGPGKFGYDPYAMTPPGVPVAANTTRDQPAEAEAAPEPAPSE